MIFDTSNDTEYKLASQMFNNLVLDQKIIKIEAVKETRSSLQSNARWRYLDLVAQELCRRGETFQTKGFKAESTYNKDNLYNNYWLVLRGNMYPGKTSQLNTKEFSDLVEMVLMMFAKVFDISISFPNFLNKLDNLNK